MVVIQAILGLSAAALLVYYVWILMKGDEQAYSGESTLSYLTQALGLTVQNFVSAATGIAVLFALIRGFTKVKETGLGSFWVDMTMLFVRFMPIIGTLAIAGSLAGKKKVAVTAGTLSTTNVMFVFLLIVIVLLIGALSFFPALALGPIAEFFQR